MRYTSRKSNRQIFIPLIILLLLAGTLAPAQTSRRKKPVYYAVQAGHTMRARLNEELYSEKARVGDTFTATLVDPVYCRRG